MFHENSFLYAQSTIIGQLTELRYYREEIVKG